MSEWKEYTGSDEQIAEIVNCKTDVLCRYRNGVERLKSQMFIGDWKHNLLTHYLICDPHPRADMIYQQARTGQPVWIKIKLNRDVVPTGYANHPCLVSLNMHRNCVVFKKSKNIEWDLVDAEYSFTEFKEEV